MRNLVVPMALALPLVLSATPTPTLALDRLHRPDTSAPVVVPVADLDHTAHARPYRHHHADAYWHWRYRAGYTRWMHNEHVRAGYPVRLRHGRTYIRADACHGCDRGRHW